MNKFILFLSILFVHTIAWSQDNKNPTYFQAGVYADIGGEFIFLHYYRTGIQKYVSKNISLQAALKAGSRSRFESNIPTERDGIATNWINWHQDNPSGNPVIFSPSLPIPKKYGISQFMIDDHSLFYANLVISAGWDLQIIDKLKLQFMGGIGLRYTDEHFIGELGDATFNYQGDEYQLYYLVPVFQRGVDSHINVEISSLYQISDNVILKAGLLSDISIGIGVGNYYHIGGSLLIKI